MVNTDMQYNFLIAMNSLFDKLPQKYHFRLHRIYHPTPVHEKWEIEKGRKIMDLHLLFVLDGKGCYYFDDKEVPLEKGKVIFVSNQYPHSAKPNLNSLPHTFSVRFGVYDNHTTQHISNYFHTPFAVDITPSNITVFHRLFQRLYSVSTRKDIYNLAPVTNALLTEILMELGAAFSNNSNSIDSRIEAVLPLMQPKQGNQFSLKQISEKVNLSEKQLSRLFKEAYDVAPHKYMIKCRIRQAIFLLEETSMSIKEIAISLGYSDPYTFSKQFKLMTGKTPSAIRSIK